jgi:hypothetical protein
MKSQGMLCTGGLCAGDSWGCSFDRNVPLVLVDLSRAHLCSSPAFDEKRML